VLLPVLGGTLRIASGLQSFEHALVGEQGFDFAQRILVSIQLVKSGRDLQA
jgi:hypothetical protein